MPIYSEQIEGLQLQLRTIADLDTVTSTEKFSHVDQEMIDMMLDQSARFAEERLAPLAQSGDVEGCRLENGRVTLPEGTPEVFQEWCELGFPLLSLPLDHDGMDFPQIVQCAVQEIMDGANLAFGMIGINLRCGPRALISHASEDLVQRWIPGMIAGSTTFTIVISEPQAGSDVARIRTSAVPAENGLWTLNGSKIWISFGDHDATEQIVHLVLARVPSEETGTRALGLFAVPKFRDDICSDENRNGVSVSRLEHKMGLHASPTCVLELENAEGYLIGEAGKGLQALFVMMNGMRLAVGVQGSAVANAASLHALEYARERPQGGKANAPAVMISEHDDVKRMLLEMTGRSELIRALVLKTAAYLDLAAAQEDETSQKIAELMLPLAKTLGAEQAFDIANQGIQVLGGYGYTNDYPLERMTRDIRVAAIYEGTSGIQALDFFKRKVMGDDGATLSLLIDTIKTDLSACPDDNPLKAGVSSAVVTFEATLAELSALHARNPDSGKAGAYHFLHLSGLVISHWLGMKLYTGATEQTAYQARLRAALELCALSLEEQALRLSKLALQTSPDLRL